MSSLEGAAFTQRLAQARQAAYNARKYNPPAYSVGNKISLSTKLITTAASNAQASAKLGVQCYGPFRILELIGKNAVLVELPHSIRIHPVIHVEHTSRRRRQSKNIAKKERKPAEPFVEEKCELVVEVDKIISHRKRGQSFQFLKLNKNSPSHEAEWKPV